MNEIIEHETEECESVGHETNEPEKLLCYTLTDGVITPNSSIIYNLFNCCFSLFHQFFFDMKIAEIL